MMKLNPNATLLSTHTPSDATNKEVNVHLDKLIVEQEPREFDAPWFGRRFFATVWSTVTGWLARH
jgi:hypothetical protein